MESAQAALSDNQVKTRYVINSTVQQIIEHSRSIHISGVGKDAIFEPRSEGWFIYLQGSYEALHVGFEKPDLSPGDKVRITVEKA